jgi:hypothetical protein
MFMPATASFNAMVRTRSVSIRDRNRLGKGASAPIFT